MGTLSAEQARKQRVLRCACGQFVRLDRALQERGSDPAAPQTWDLESAVDHGRAKQEAVALGGRPRSHAPLSAQAGDERVSHAVARSTLHSLSQAQWKPPSTPTHEKPLWYVDLGGIETVEMTIEQLIIARRSGKLGEGALVWREGMAHWRPVGTLIPATSVAPPPRLTPPPSAAPLPALRREGESQAASLPVDGSPQSLGSYERPVATLEFALETAEASASVSTPRARQPGKDAPSLRSTTPAPRSTTPAPRLTTPAPRLTTPAPRLTTPVPRLTTPVPRLTTPLPQLAAPASLTPIAMAYVATPLPTQSAPLAPRAAMLGSVLDWLGQRPRWVSACIAVSVCLMASGSGALLVRSLKQHKQPLTLTSNGAIPNAASGAPSASSQADVARSAPPEHQPQIVNVESLSVERSARRSSARAQASSSVRPPALKATVDHSDEATATSDSESSAVLQKLRDADLPAAARSNPYMKSDDAPVLKPAPVSDSDSPGF